MIPTFDAVTIQATPLCNLMCRYCYLGHSAPQPHHVGFIPVGLVKKVFADLVNYHKENNINTGISVTFHGGEPLLLGHVFFKESLEFLKTLSETHNIPIRKNIQTNLTLLDDTFCSIFKEHNMSVSTSIDGPEDLHDRYRVSNSGGTHALVMEKVALAKSYKLNVGAICTVTKDKLTEAKRIHYFFLENDIGYKTNSLCMQGGAMVNWRDLRASLNEFAGFFCELFDLWYDGPPSLMIQNMIEVMRLVLEGAEYGGSCSNTNCAYRQFTIAHNGDCTPCGRTVGVPEFSLGNMWKDDFFAIAKSPVFNTLSKRIPDSIDECTKCDLKDVCYSGCMYDAFLEHGTIFAPGGDCEAYRNMFNHVRDRILTDVKHHYVNSRR